MPRRSVSTHPPVFVRCVSCLLLFVAAVVAAVVAAIVAAVVAIVDAVVCFFLSFSVFVVCLFGSHRL